MFSSLKTENGKYIIKTIKDLELDYFLSILGDYYYHMLVRCRLFFGPVISESALPVRLFAHFHVAGCRLL